MLLFCHEHDTAAAFADLLEQLVTTDEIARFLVCGSKREARE
jgi:hypothetical protein